MGVSFLRRPTPVSPSREPSPDRSGPPTDNPHQHWKEEHPHLHIDKNNKSKSLSNYAQQDLSIATQGPQILDMQRLQSDTDSSQLAADAKDF
jgi:hypothetical protein